MAKIVVVDDERDILEVLEFNLRQAGHEVLTASTGREGLELGLKRNPDLIILDLMLPDLSGTEVCRTIRAATDVRQVPILMLSARSDEIDRVVGFELGADDYVTKPFSVRELMLRVRAVLGRSRPVPTARRAAALQFGRLRIDREAHRVWVDQEELILTALEFKLLVTLFERRNRVQTRTSLLEHVWGIHAHISTRTVDAHVKRLREKLAGARDYVETVRGVGYRFKESVDDADGSLSDATGDDDDAVASGSYGMDAAPRGRGPAALERHT
jgi:two-component system phosphate regulon response regulator PhoB